MVVIRYLLLFVLILGTDRLFLNSSNAQAGEITHRGLTFSDELGGFILESVTGNGTTEDPFVITEKFQSTRSGILIIKGLHREKNNRAGTHHTAGIAIKKIVHNATMGSWPNFEIELRKVATRPSPYEDGLSFAQNSILGTTYISSNFPHIQKTDEPGDTLSYSGEDIQPGSGAYFNFVVTEMSPGPMIYLVQRPLQPIAQSPHVIAPVL